MTLEFTAAALSAVRRIRAYTSEKWGPQQEASYLDGLWTKFEEIIGSPSKWRARDDLFPGCKIAAHGKHVILFRIEKDVLQVVRILHSSMDLPRHIPKN